MCAIQNLFLFPMNTGYLATLNLPLNLNMIRGMDAAEWWVPDVRRTEKETCDLLDFLFCLFVPIAAYLNFIFEAACEI
jgi:hypothetical protein